MTDAVTTPVTIPARMPLTALGDPAAAACEGDFCAVPGHHEQAVVNHRLDEDPL